MQQWHTVKKAKGQEEYSKPRLTEYHVKEPKELQKKKRYKFVLL